MEFKKNKCKVLNREDLNNLSEEELKVKLIKTDYHINGGNHVIHNTYRIISGKYKNYRFIESRLSKVN